MAVVNRNNGRQGPHNAANRKICKIQDNPKHPSPEQLLFELCDELPNLSTKASGLHELLRSLQRAVEYEQYEYKDTLTQLENLSFEIKERIQELASRAEQ